MEDTGFDTVRLRMKGLLCLCSSYSCVVSNISCKWKCTGSQEFSFLAYVDAIF